MMLSSPFVRNNWGWMLSVAETIIVNGGKYLGRSIGKWIGPPSWDPGREFITAERRQGCVCVAAALTSYYVRAFIFVIWHDAGLGAEPYLRAHLFDGFGCAALYTLVFRHFRKFHPVTGGDRRIDRLRAASQLALASTAIAAASVYVAGADVTVAIIYGLLVGLVLLSFWYGVVSGTPEN